METVPEAIRQALDLIGAADDDARLAGLRQARMGLGPVVEAHPRPFLYSALERITRLSDPPLSARLLREISRYKSEDAPSAKKARKLALMTLRTRQQWQGLAPLQLECTEDVYGALLSDHHFFDAFLAACTAWCHLQRQTISWKEAGIPEHVVATEGHILVLRQDGERGND